MTDLKVATLNAHLHIKLIDKDDSILYELERESRSWVRNYYHFILACTSMRTYEIDDSTGMIDIDNAQTSDETMPGSYSSAGVVWAFGSGDTNGPIVGTGTAAEDFEGYALAARIDDGTASGEFVYSNVANTYSIDGTTRKSKMERTFTNSSGASITVNECGLYANTKRTATAMDSFMFNRDKLAVGIAVANGQSLYVAYIMSLDFGA